MVALYGFNDLKPEAEVVVEVIDPYGHIRDKPIMRYKIFKN